MLKLPITSTTGRRDSAGTQYQAATSVLWGLSGYKSVRLCHPDAAQIFRLWQLFLDNVHPLSKLLHAPSVQRQITDATSYLDFLSRDLEALMFAIYLTAVNSLKDSQCESLLGERKGALHRKFLAATEQALVNAECLKSCSLVVLQALTLYLVSLLFWCSKYETLAKRISYACASIMTINLPGSALDSQSEADNEWVFTKRRVSLIGFLLLSRKFVVVCGGRF
jgi:hypothetical protein